MNESFKSFVSRTSVIRDLISSRKVEVDLPYKVLIISSVLNHTIFMGLVRDYNKKSLWKSFSLLLNHMQSHRKGLREILHKVMIKDLFYFQR